MYNHNQKNKKPKNTFNQGGEDLFISKDTEKNCRQKVNGKLFHAHRLEELTNIVKMSTQPKEIHTDSM